VEEFNNKLYIELGIRLFSNNHAAHVLTHIVTEKPIVAVIAPGVNSGKLVSCLSQIYHEYKRGVKALIKQQGGKMSYQNFNKATALAVQCAMYRTGGGKTDEIISKASEILNIKFSEQNYKYFKDFGYIQFDGAEIFGIVLDDFSGDPEANCVETAVADRRDYNLPKQWLPIYFFDDGYYGYLDYSNLNEYGEPPVIMAIYNGKEYVVAEKVAEDLGDFLLGLVEKQLASE